MTEANTDRHADPGAAGDTIDAGRFRDALLAGIHQVMEKRDYINKINVFPVADADTGTNLAFTFYAIVQGVRADVPATVGELTRRIADLALDGARGNSGAIFAQYLQGFSEVTADLDVLTPASYARAALEGSRSAQSAIAEPREGTMLSVIGDYARELKRQLDAGIVDFESLLGRGLERARESLANTPNQLEVLRQNGVVDAGAQGFVELLEGIQLYLQKGASGDLLPETLGLAEADLPPEAIDHNAEHRFCTECVISGEDIDRNQLRDEIQGLGASSLVIAGTKRKVRVHVHVDNPGALFVICEKFGGISSQKADDMHQQHQSAHGARQRVAVVSDTGADLPEEEIERLGVHLVPLRVNFGDRQYLDKVSLTPGEFFQRSRSADDVPRTSQPPPGDFRRQFEFLASHFENVLCLTVSSALSGTWQAASGAARRTGEGIAVFDTLNASAGQGLLVMYAAEAANTRAELSQVLRLIGEAAGNTQTYAVIPDMSHGVRGGRLPGWVKRAADLLRLTPVIGTTEEGLIRPRGALLGRDNLTHRFARWLARHADEKATYRVLIAHCGDRDGARALRDALVRALGRVHSVYVTEAGAAIGAHAGPGALVVGLQRYEPVADALARMESSTP